jgi:phage-related protein
MDFSIEKIIDALEKDVKSRKRLAELIVIEPDIRLAIINAIIRDVATKSDIEKLRIETKEDIEKLRSEFRNEMHQFRNELNQFRSELNQLRSEVHSNFRWIVGLIFGMWTSMMVCLIPILLKLIGMI